MQGNKSLYCVCHWTVNIQIPFTGACIQFPLIGFQADSEQKTLLRVNHSVTYIGFDDSRPTGPLKDPISAPNGTEKWVSGIADSIFVFLSGRWKEARLYICGCEDCDLLPFSSSPHSTELMTAALSCYGLEGGETVGVVIEGRGITVLNLQMEFCSLSLWNNLLGFLSHVILPPRFPKSLRPNPFICVWEIMLCICILELFYNGQWTVAGKVKGIDAKSLFRFRLTFKQAWNLFVLSVLCVHSIFNLDKIWMNLDKKMYLCYPDSLFCVIKQFAELCDCYFVLASAVVFKTYWTHLSMSFFWCG